MTDSPDNLDREGILSPEETDALLQGIEDGSVRTSQGHGRPAGETRLYDFAECERLARGAMPTLQIIDTRIARSLRGSLSELLRKPVEVETASSELCRFSDHMPTLPTPASLNLVRMRPLPGIILIVPSNELIYMTVDCFFGGTGVVPDNTPAREFTQVERRMIALLLERSFDAITQSWEPVMELAPELIGQEQNPHFAAIASAADRVIVTKYVVQLADQQAALQVIMPRSMLDPVEALLDSAPRSDDDDENEQWTQALHERLRQTHIGLHATLSETTLRLGDVLELQAGDVIPVDLPDQIVLQTPGTALYTGRAGASRKRNAIEITGRCEQQPATFKPEDH